MKNKSNLLLTLLFSLILISNIKLYPQQINYDIFQLNLEVATPWAINDSTEIVGQYLDGGVYTAFHWSSGVITALSPGFSSEALSINNRSEIVGRLENLAHYWSEDTTFSLLLPGTTFSKARSINNLGNIVGYSGGQAFFYDGNLNALSNPAGYNLSDASAINGANVIVGYSRVSDSPARAVRWQNGIPELIDAQYDTSEAYSINNQNVTVGWFGDLYTEAFIWAGNTVTVLPRLPGYSHPNHNNIARDINDNNVIVGYIGGGPAEPHAWIWEDGIMDDLNNQIPPDSNITLRGAYSINNWGEIICHGYTTGYQTHIYLLKPITINITKPKQGDKWIAGETDTIKWKGGRENEVIKIKYSTDAGNNFELIDAGINVSDTMYVWDLPDTLLGRRCLIRIERNSNSDILAESDTFKIKPYIITRIDQNGNYVKYDINTDRWGFGNTKAEMWPVSWWLRFNYIAGRDPFTNLAYPQHFCDSIFAKTKFSDRPDWISFVNSFGINNCYTYPALGIYRTPALLYWKAIKKKWAGSCFGIAISNALAFEKKDKFLNKYPNFPNFGNPIAVNSDTNVIPVIMELFTHQFGNPHLSYRYAVGMNESPSKTIGNLKHMLQEDSVGIRILSMVSNSTDPLNQGAHAIIAYKLKRDDTNPELYYVYVYDNSYPNILDARILVDTSYNGGVGLWDPEYAWDGWEGDKGFYLSDPANGYLTNVGLPKGKDLRSPFILNENELNMYNTSDAYIIIEDNVGNQTGYTSGGIITEIPNSVPLIVEDGGVGPPYGYHLPTDNYSVIMNNLVKDTLNTFFFTGNKSFEYERYGATETQTDRLFFDGGVSVTNPDNELKTIKLLNIVSDTTQIEDRLFVVRHLDLLQNDSVKIENEDNDKLKLISYGSAKDYGIGLEYTSESSFGLFGHLNIELSANTTHTFIPNWSDITNSDLTVYVDIGNNGTIDDTLHLQNQVTSVGEDQGSLIPTEYRLEQNYPNPFNNSTVIRYSIPKKGIVTLKIYNSIGEEITTLVNEVKQPGNYEVTFSTEKLSSGVYFYKIQVGSFVKTKKMVLMK